MTVKTKSRHSASDVEMEKLHNDIADGKREAPNWFSREGRRYRRWTKQNEKTARQLTTARERAAGRTPVAFDNSYATGASATGFAAPYGGHSDVVSAPTEWQTTSNLGGGFNPNVVGAAAPVIGTPIGRHIMTEEEVACDAMSWFREGIIANPSAFVLSLPGLGKSTLIRKMLMGHVYQGQVPIIAGDIKGEYVGFVQQVGGQVITIGHGRGRINPLDVGALGRIIPRMSAARDEKVAQGEDTAEIDDLIRQTLEEVHGRQVSMVGTLVGLGRGIPMADWESMLVSIALREIYETVNIDWDNPPILKDLISHLENGSPELKSKGRARTDTEWAQRVDDLVLSLNALLDGATGQIFAGQTTTAIDVDATAVCIDVSAINRGDARMKAAVMMACWSNAFGAIEAAHTLHDAGLAPQKYFNATLDELWQVLSAAPGMVGQIDALTRLNRTDGTSLCMITHTFKDLRALPTEEDRQTAMGFIERAGMVICGGLPSSELGILSDQLEFSPAEAAQITSWSKGAELKRTRTKGHRPPPPGRGYFMIKPSKDGSPGIPVRTVLLPTEIEYRLHDTNQAFDDFFLGER